VAASKTPACWKLAPHTGAKLALLGAYLAAWFPILSRSGAEHIIYIDGFAGPGNYIDGEDGSPIVALKALGVRGNQVRASFHFHFVERMRRMALALDGNIAALRAANGIPHNAVIRIHARTTFAEAFEATIGPELARFPGAPAFALVDPFGWTGIPLAIMQRLMTRPRTELLVNFMFEEVNRFLNHPDQPKNFDELFGCENWRQGYSLAGPARRKFLHDLYQQQLHTVAGAKYVRSFEMVNERGASDYFLFFATNNLLGLSKMKEAMWKVDPGGGARFSDTTNPDQLVLLAPEPDRHLLRRQLVERFSGKRVRVADVERFVLEDTAFHAGHYKKVLGELEKTDSLTVPLPPRNRRTCTFPDAMMVLEFVQSPSGPLLLKQE